MPLLPVAAVCVAMTKSGAVAGKASPLYINTVKAGSSRQTRFLHSFQLGGDSAGTSRRPFDAHLRFVWVAGGSLLPHRQARDRGRRGALDDNRGCRLRVGLLDLGAQGVGA